MGRWSRSSPSPPAGIEEQSRIFENVVVEVIEAQARAEDTQARNEDSGFEDVEITLTPVELGKDHHEVTNKEGKAIFWDVPAGEYTVTAKKDGFKFQQIAIPKEELRPSRQVSENGHINMSNINAVRKVRSNLHLYCPILNLFYLFYLHEGECQLDAEDDGQGYRDVTIFSK